jgi:hypothetical protein
MATIITKNSQTASAVPSAASLSVGELAVNTADGKLYTEHTGGVVKEIIPSTVADGGITTAKIVDANVTLPKLSTTGTPSSSTFLRGDGAWSTVPSLSQTDLDNLASGTAPQPKIVLKAFNDFYSSNAVAGTTILFQSRQGNTISTTNITTYLDWRTISNDYISFDEANNNQSINSQSILASTTTQFGFIALLGGTYRISYTTKSTNTSTGNETRILVNGNQQYLVQHLGTTNTNRSFDVTVNPFDQVVLQLRRYTGTGYSDLLNYKVGTTGGGLIIKRN